MNYAIEMMENAPGQGSKIIARELKTLLRDYDFVFAEKDYPTTIEDNKIGTFEFILPDYFPTIWPTSAEFEEAGKVKIKYNSEIEKNTAEDDANADDKEIIESFKEGSKVIMPADGIITVCTPSSITIKFTEQNSYNMEMTISGIKVDTAKAAKGTKLKRKNVIGETMANDITITLKDADGSVRLVSDYMDGVFLRYNSIKAGGRVYPVYKQKESPWGTVNFYRPYKNPSKGSSEDKTYSEVGSGSTVVAMAISGLTKKQIIPSDIRLKINEVLINEMLENGGKYDSYYYPDGYYDYVTSKGLSTKFFKSETEEISVEWLEGGIWKEKINTYTNKFLSEYGIQTFEIDAFDKIKKYTDQGFPVVVYATSEKTDNKQYYLLLKSEYEQEKAGEDKNHVNYVYDYYLIDPAESKNNGQYTSEKIKDIFTFDAGSRAFALNYSGIGGVKTDEK